jgi:hypothetical protein
VQVLAVDGVVVGGAVVGRLLLALLAVDCVVDLVDHVKDAVLPVHPRGDQEVVGEDRTSSGGGRAPGPVLPVVVVVRGRRRRPLLVLLLVVVVLVEGLERGLVRLYGVVVRADARACVERPAREEAVVAVAPALVDAVLLPDLGYDRVRLAVVVVLPGAVVDVVVPSPVIVPTLEQLQRLITMVNGE